MCYGFHHDGTVCELYIAASETDLLPEGTDDAPGESPEGLPLTRGGVPGEAEEPPGLSSRKTGSPRVSFSVSSLTPRTTRLSA